VKITLTLEIVFQIVCLNKLCDLFNIAAAPISVTAPNLQTLYVVTVGACRLIFSALSSDGKLYKRFYLFLRKALKGQQSKVENHEVLTILKQDFNFERLLS